MMKVVHPFSEFRIGRPWRVKVPWIFMPATLICLIGLVPVEGFVICRFLRRCPELLAEALIQLSMVTAVMLIFSLIPPRGELAGKLGLRRLRWGDVGIVFLGLLLIYAWQLFSMPLWSMMLRLLNLQVPQQQELLTECSRSSRLKFLGMLALAGVLIPFVEEVVYRRVLFGAFSPLGKLAALLKLPRPLGVAAALVATALIFAAMHGFLYGFPALFGLGAVFQWQYLRTRNLLTSTLTHMIYNIISLTLVFLLR